MQPSKLMNNAPRTLRVNPEKIEGLMEEIQKQKQKVTKVLASNFSNKPPTAYINISILSLTHVRIEFDFEEEMLQNKSSKWHASIKQQ